MRIKKGRYAFLIVEVVCFVLFFAIHSINSFREWRTTQKSFELYVLGIIIILAIVAVAYGVYEFICKTYYDFTDQCVQIIKRKKVLYKIWYAKIIEVEYQSILDCDIIPLPFFRMNINYYNENGQLTHIDVYCPLHRLKKVKEFPMQKVAKR